MPVWGHESGGEAVWCCSLQGWLFHGGPPQLRLVAAGVSDFQNVRNRRTPVHHPYPYVEDGAAALW